MGCQLHCATGFLLPDFLYKEQDGARAGVPIGVDLAVIGFLNMRGGTIEIYRFGPCVLALFSGQPLFVPCIEKN